MFLVKVHQYEFRAIDRVAFPAGKAGNTVRGALGLRLDAGTFRPRRENGPSGLLDFPRPFALRVSHLDGKVFEPGECLTLGINVFGPGFSPDAAVADAARSGMGSGRGRMELVAATVEEVRLVLEAPEEAASLRVEFRTPVELKGNPEPREIPFGILLARVRDRVSALHSAYAEGPLQADFRGLGERARRVVTVRSELVHREARRTSSRTGQEHGLGGVTGFAEYAGPLGEFMPWLRAAVFTGVGRHTVWGNGEISLAG